MRVVLMGPPGAGKGTLAKMLVEDFGMSHLSSGDIFRSEAASGSPLGAELSKYMKAGKLVPDETVVAVMAKAISDASAPGGLLLDGFPRTVPQAKALDEQLAAQKTPLDAVAVILASEDVIVDRITGRRVHLPSGRVYHVRNIPPRVADKDDVTGEPLIQREDDREEVVRKRLDAYRKQTEPVIAYYRSRPALPVIEVQADGPAQETRKKLVAALKGLGA